MIEYEFLDYKEKLSIPLYKYYGNLENAKKTIINHSIHFESPKDYNDIYDSTTYLSDSQISQLMIFSKNAIQLIGFVLKSDYDKKMFKSVVAPKFQDQAHIRFGDILEETESTLIKISKSEIINRLRPMLSMDSIMIFDNYKISCFSENKDSLLMWAYYADKYNGVCLEFDFSDDKYLSSHCHKVQYSRHFDAGNISYTYFTKSEEWSHEQEWRMVSRNLEYLDINNCLKAVYLGCRMKNKEQLEFIELCKKYKLDLYMIMPSHEEYKLKFLPQLKKGEYCEEDI